MRGYLPCKQQDISKKGFSSIIPTAQSRIALSSFVEPHCDIRYSCQILMKLNLLKDDSRGGIWQGTNNDAQEVKNAISTSA
jgi:hypothetical protein